MMLRVKGIQNDFLDSKAEHIFLNAYEESLKSPMHKYGEYMAVDYPLHIHNMFVFNNKLYKSVCYESLPNENTKTLLKHMNDFEQTTIIMVCLKNEGFVKIPSICFVKLLNSEKDNETSSLEVYLVTKAFDRKGLQHFEFKNECWKPENTKGNAQNHYIAHK